MKNLNVKNQNGRSMIEMLGVLAIIGVLSVGGIAGYSKAMTKYRINKTIEQITLIAGNIRAFFANQGNYAGLSSSDTGKAIIKKAKLVPDEMLELNTDGTIKQINNAFGGRVSLSLIGGNKQDFEMYLTNVPQEACIELLTKDWITSSVYAIFMAVDNSHGDIPLSIGGSGSASDNLNLSYNNCESSSYSGKNGIPVSVKFVCSSTLPLDTAITWCSSSDNNGFSLLFH
ncbi:MAG: hypothetical protein IJ525_02090 [Alphaproteobacteria bacterium]|nr:hypothetical protein [Alphaproteobacteria bacterium]